MANNFDPIIDALDKSVQIGRQLQVTTLYKFLDLDGDELQRLRLSDQNADQTSGYFTYRGRRLAAGQTHEFNRNQLGQLRYVAGLVPGQERFSLAGYDGRFWSDTDSATLKTIAANRKPTVRMKRRNGLANESMKVSTFIQANDPENAGIKRYRLRARSGSGGYLTVRGKEIRRNRWITFTGNTIDQVELQGENFGKGNRNVTLEARVYDGRDWSDVAKQTFIVRPNTRGPIVTPNNVELDTGQSTLATNFIRERDPNGNTFKQVQVQDTGVKAEGGYFVFKGKKLAARKWHVIDYDEMSQLRYQGASTVDRERLRFRVSDGRYWSKIASALVETVSTPVITTTDVAILEDLEDVRVGSLFSQQDEGPSVRKYRIYDGNTDNRSARMYDANGNRLAQGRVYEFTAAEFNSITIRGGKSEDRWHDQFMVRASNGQRWSDWERLDVYTEPNHKDSLNFGNWWSNSLGEGRELTYTFLQQVPFYYAPDSDERGGTFLAFNQEQRIAARRALQQYANVTGLTFRETTQEDNIGHITFGLHDNMPDGAAAYGYFPSSIAPAPPGDTWYDSTYAPHFTGLDDGEEGYMIFLHELGHATGLTHPFDNFPFLPESTNSQRFTVMAYNPTPTGSGAGVFPSTLMLYDVAMLQEYYGANTNYNRGKTVYSWSRDENVVMNIWDSGGIDTINLSNQVDRQIVDLREGRLNSIGNLRQNVTISFGTIIERARGGQNNDRLTGNEVNNILDGNEGNDILAGMGGLDTLRGGAGNDIYVYNVGDDNDRIDEQNKGGTDRLQIQVQEGLYTNFPRNALTGHLKFRRLGRDLQVSLTMNENESRGMIRIVNQAQAGSRVETLRLMYGDTKAERKDIDLNSIFVQSTNRFQSFAVTDFKTANGFVAAPV